MKHCVGLEVLVPKSVKPVLGLAYRRNEKVPWMRLGMSIEATMSDARLSMKIVAHTMNEPLCVVHKMQDYEIAI
jgi:hypothetical protein